MSPPRTVMLNSCVSNGNDSKLIAVKNTPLMSTEIRRNALGGFTTGSFWTSSIQSELFRCQPSSPSTAKDTALENSMTGGMNVSVSTTDSSRKPSKVDSSSPCPRNDVRYLLFFLLCLSSGVTSTCAVNSKWTPILQMRVKDQRAKQRGIK